MEMWLRRSIPVLVTTAVAALMVLDQPPVIVDKTQRRLEVPFGSSVTFHCGLRTETYERFRVAWHFNPSGSSINTSCKPDEILNNSVKISGVVSNKTKLNPAETYIHFQYTLSNATAQNSGWYFCVIIIEIPLLTCDISSGTEVVIMKRMEPTTYPSLLIVTATVSPINNFFIDWWMWIILGVSAFILIVLLAMCFLLRRRCHKNRGEDPIYANTRPVANKQPSPRPRKPRMDNLKPVSSSQNLRDPSQGRKYNEGKQRYK